MSSKAVAVASSKNHRGRWPMLRTGAAKGVVRLNRDRRSGTRESAPRCVVALLFTEHGPDILIGLLQEDLHRLRGPRGIARSNSLEDVAMLLQAVLMMEVGA